MEDYELFHLECNMLQVEEEAKEKDMFLLEYGVARVKEGVARVNETPTHQFAKDKPIQYKDSTLKETNLGDEGSSKTILVGDDWNPVLKEVAFKIFMEYKDVFAWTYKDLKGVPPKLCVHRIPLIPRAHPV